jgi:hypothetical protein
MPTPPMKPELVKPVEIGGQQRKIMTKLLPERRVLDSF